MNTKIVKNFLFVFSLLSFMNLYSQDKYNFEGHSDFNVFLSDFKTAVNEGDKEAVLKMTVIPFIDQYQDIYNKSKSVTSNSKGQFLKNYDKIFREEIVVIINCDAYTVWSKEAAEKEENDPDGHESFQVISEGEYIICGSKDCDYPNLIFSLADGMYKLSRIPYYE